MRRPLFRAAGTYTTAREEVAQGRDLHRIGEVHELAGALDEPGRRLLDLQVR